MRGLTSSSALALLVALSAPAFAQTAAPDDSAPKPAPVVQPGEKPVLDEIVVTADRKKSYSADLVQAGSFRGARQLDTPLTVSVIPREVINSQQAQGLLDALKNTAGVTSSQTAPTVFNNIAIRGINVENRGNFRLNGSLPIINLIDLPLEDKDRVEALKGASALYYGFTTPSGIINMTMKRPTREQLLTATVFGNDHGAVGGHVDAGNTMGIFGYRINAVYGSVDSGIDHTRGIRSLVSGAFDLKPADNLTISVDAEHIYKKVNEPGVYRFVAPFPASTQAVPYPSLVLPPLIDQKTNYGPAWARNRAAENNLLAHVVWNISDAWSLTGDAGTSRENRTRISSTLSPVNRGYTDLNDLLMLILPDADYRNRYLRSELAGTFFTGPFLHEVLVGVTQNHRYQFTPNSISINCTAAGAATLSPVNAAAGITSCKQNIFNPIAVPEIAPPVRTGTASTIDDLGYYVFDRIKYGEWLQLLGGVRKSNYKEQNTTTGVVTTKVKPTSISYGAVVKPKSWASIYATYIEGLETTPLAPVTAVNSGAQLPATTSKQKEGGIKIEPKSGLLLQLAYFDITRASTFVNAANLYVQDGRARYKGVEFSLTGEVTRDFSIYASAVDLSAKQVSGAADVIVRNAAGTITSFSPTLVGRRIENTAKWSWSVAGEYRLGALIDGLSVNGGVYYTGARAIDSLNRAFAPSFTLLNGGIALSQNIYDQQVTFRLNGENLANKRYFASTGQDLLAQGSPRTVKFAVTTAF